MNIHMDTQAIRPMTEWLKARKQGRADEGRLREIFAMSEYQTEFARYGEENLPVCRLTLEEAVDFFLHFDEKDFENPRLQIKKPIFEAFYADMDAALEKADVFLSINRQDEALMTRLLQNALPEALLARQRDFNILLNVSVGNSQGYPYENNIVFDVTNLSVFPDRLTATMVLAHEIHHTFFGALIPENLSPQALFAVNFAFEGLAIHFCNNGETKGKMRKYADLPATGVSEEDFARYRAEHDALFDDFKRDYHAARGMTEAQVMQMISDKYEQFEYASRVDGQKHASSQYPTYYLGCMLWGSIDLALGKEALLHTLAHPETFADDYNRAARKLGNDAYLL